MRLRRLRVVALMPTTSWNDDEDDALRKLPWRARVAYLQGIRRYMDYATGWSGRTRVLSYQFFIELLEATERSTDPDPAVTKDGLRAIFRMLERVGLVEWPRGTSSQRGVVFRCILASTDQSVQKQDAPKTHPRRTHEDAPIQAFTGEAFGVCDAPKTHPSVHTQDAPPPVSGTPVEKKEADASSCGARKTLSRFAEFWDAWPAGQRKRDRLKAEKSWDRQRLDNRADMIIADVKARAVGDQQWLSGYTPLPTTYLNGHRWEDEMGAPKPGARAASVHEHNRSALDAWLGSEPSGTATIIEGVFRREAK